MQMIVVGGRHSICQAFATSPTLRYAFAAPARKTIYASHESSSRKGWAFRTGAMRTIQLMIGPGHIVMEATAASCKAPLSFGANFVGLFQRTYSPKVNMAVAGVLHEAAKTRTVLHPCTSSPKRLISKGIDSVPG